ncbi:hypothetical protein KI688_009751 [Linnemannia hyalina]|uniref:Uncharacterized protein n=1 Tax=Linnemannia hyalina TaxID=64524 RepID=A0A9P7XZG4_9FUNG|nr:hypothetical protein KI688_009751 [Linnemannia hyalina]
MSPRASNARLEQLNFSLGDVLTRLTAASEKMKTGYASVQAGGGINHQYWTSGGPAIMTALPEIEACLKAVTRISQSLTSLADDFHHHPAPTPSPSYPALISLISAQTRLQDRDPTLTNVARSLDEVISAILTLNFADATSKSPTNRPSPHPNLMNFTSLTGSAHPPLDEASDRED